MEFKVGIPMIRTYRTKDGLRQFGGQILATENDLKANIRSNPEGAQYMREYTIEEIAKSRELIKDFTAAPFFFKLNVIEDICFVHFANLNFPDLNLTRTR
jgi:hypothetical protein